jgi:hypothetical protein
MKWSASFIPVAPRQAPILEKEAIMSLRKTSVAVIAVVATLATLGVGHAVAQQGAGTGFGLGIGRMIGWGPGSGQGKGMGQGMGQGATMNERGRFKDVDANQDGVLQLTELTDNAEGVFAAMDADGSGDVTKDEYMALRLGPQDGVNPLMQSYRQSQKEARFAPLDKDGNGTVGHDEFVGGMTARFTAADADNSGTLTRPEMRAMR